MSVSEPVELTTVDVLAELKPGHELYANEIESMKVRVSEGR